MVPFRFNPVPLEAAGNGGPRQMVTPAPRLRPDGGEQNPAYVLLSTPLPGIPACCKARSGAVATASSIRRPVVVPVLTAERRCSGSIRMEG